MTAWAWGKRHTESQSQTSRDPPLVREGLPIAGGLRGIGPETDGAELLALPPAGERKIAAQARTAIGAVTRGDDLTGSLLGLGHAGGLLAAGLLLGGALSALCVRHGQYINEAASLSQGFFWQPQKNSDLFCGCQ